MAKKLKKKIEEMCGLNGLDWEARQERAEKILASTEWKQSLCNELQGLSFRELEQTLIGVASERQKKEESYERKLKAYNDKTDRSGKYVKPKPLRGDMAKSSGPRNVPKSVPRTLAQILAQVYAPRESEKVPSWHKEERFMALFAKTTEEDCEEVPERLDDGDDKADKSGT